MKKVIFLFLFTILLGTFSASAQGGTFQPKQLDNSNRGIVYNKELAIDLRLHTHGWAIAANFGTIKTYYKTRFYHIEIGELKHPKEQRYSFDYPSQFGGRASRSFIFGKQNNLYVVRGGIGVKRYYSEKAKRKGVAVGISYEGGPSLGLIKPYYLDFYRVRNNDPGSAVIISEKYDGSNQDNFLNVASIYGASGFTKGFGELSVTPGLHGKIAVHFDWGAFDEFVKAFEAGIMVDVFLKEVPIMVDAVENAENRAVFINLYLTLQLGKRW